MGTLADSDLDKQLVANLEKTAQLIRIQNEMKLALYRDIYPDQPVPRLRSLISQEIIDSKTPRTVKKIKWNTQKT